MKKRFKEMSLRSIIMILCSSFVSLIIVTSATFYITGISHINNLVKQNAANLTIQAAENMDKRFRKVKDSFFSSIMESYYFLKMGQNIMENRQPISAKHYAELARKIQDYVNQNRQDVSVVILMLSNNSIVLTASGEEEFYRCYQPEMCIRDSNMRELYLYRRIQRFKGSGINRKSMNRKFCDELLLEKVKSILYEKGR